MRSVCFCALVPPALDEVMVMEKFPETNGIPLRRPVEAFMVRPVGKGLAAKLVGLLIAVAW